MTLTCIRFGTWASYLWIIAGFVYEIYKFGCGVPFCMWYPQWPTCKFNLKCLPKIMQMIIQMWIHLMVKLDFPERDFVVAFTRVKLALLTNQGIFLGLCSWTSYLWSMFSTAWLLVLEEVPATKEILSLHTSKIMTLHGSWRRDTY